MSCDTKDDPSRYCKWPRAPQLLKVLWLTFLGCAKHVTLSLEAQAGKVEAALWVLSSRREWKTLLQQFFICLW
ncbi:hypothetical protein E2C01_035461 [Portunus trituberculatus]|uniref:Uncharacterized protein n=1 Tax=Portunus trituberculatus TaxID=210409 RepID=A0A5B7FBI9_PORTR|nr:hypothetical protein [Portunus trituberculatus]